MLGKRSRPLIMKLSGSSFQPSPSGTVNIATTTTAITSPRSPLDFQIPVSKTMTGSPAVKNNFNNENIIKCSYDRVGYGVGLGLIIALEESNYDGTGGEKILVNYGIRNSSTPRSVPIPVNLCRRSRYAGRGGGSYFRGENNDLYYNRGKLGNDEEEEDYTLVIRRGGADDKTVTTRVYCDDDRDCRGKHQSGNDYSGYCRNDYTVATTMSRSRQKKDGGASAVFKISSGFCCDEEEVESRTNRSDFLSNCHMCRKTLTGKDIYMYRGEKAFCSEECRQRQIASDERKEKKFCRSEAVVAMAAASTSFRSSSPSNSRSPYHYEAMFTAGMVAV